MKKSKFLEYFLKAIILLSIFAIYNIYLLSYIYKAMGLIPSLLILGWVACILIAAGIFIKLEKYDKEKTLNN